jgi:hypoxanthine phosphoribosyltransferase
MKNLKSNVLEDHLTKVLFTKEDINKRIKELGAQITEDYQDKDLVIVGILRGALVFLSDLSRAISLPHAWDMCGASSYGASTTSSGHVQITKDVEMNLRDKDLVSKSDPMVVLYTKLATEDKWVEVNSAFDMRIE